MFDAKKETFGKIAMLVVRPLFEPVLCVMGFTSNYSNY